MSALSFPCSSAFHTRTYQGSVTPAFSWFRIPRYLTITAKRSQKSQRLSKPWEEVLLARAGAAYVLTVEYGSITSKHARFTTTTPPNLAALMITAPRTWDFAFTYSSLEHSGLGRCGDALHPWGDMEAAVQTWCLLKPGGIFFLGLPCKDASCSEDVLLWNAHQIYGQRRLQEGFAGYEVVKKVNTTYGVARASIVYVLRKPFFYIK